MSLAAASSGASEAKKFRFSLPTQVVVNEFDFEKNRQSSINNNDDSDGNEPMSEETTVYDNMSENGLDLSSTSKLSPSSITGESNVKREINSPSPPPTMLPMAMNNNNNPQVPNMAGMSGGVPPFEIPLAVLLQQASAVMKNFSAANNLSKEDLKASILAQSRGPPPAVPPTPPAPIPGALAVAASPAAQLFSEDDWSWHRNPAAAIRSGGTNKQTPVWKYFVYNKAENLSRCIIGDCTYMLKGPHTSTLACHLKKHPVEYAEFQKLKQEYTRERNAGQLNSSGMSLSRTSQSSSAENSARQTPVLNTPVSMVNQSNGTNGTIQNPMFKMNQSVKPEPSTPPMSSGIFGNATYKNSIPPKGPSKNSSMTDILNLLNARASANASPQRSKHSTPQPSMPTSQAETSTPSHPMPMMPIPTAALMAAQTGNPFFINFLKHNPQFMNNFNSNNNNNLQTPNNNTMNTNSNNLNVITPNIPHINVSSAVNTTSQISPRKGDENPKKWQRQDRKQRELEVKLGLAIATAQLSPALIKNPFFRDFLETAQPKFTIPIEVNHIDELINSQFARTVAAVKLQLAAAPKIALLVDVLNIDVKSSLNDEENLENLDVSEDCLRFASSKRPSVRLCISAAYYSSSTESMEVVLLGIRKPSPDFDINDAVKNVVEQLMSEYDLDWDRISRVVTCGLSDLEAASNVLPRMLEPYNRKLTLSLINIFDSDADIIELKRDFYTMIYKFLAKPEYVAQLCKLAGRLITLPVGEPFVVLADCVLKLKDGILAVCSQQILDNPVPVLSENQWVQLESAVKLLSLFRVHMSVIQDGRFATIDRVVPSLMQLKVSLERDFTTLGSLPQKLLEDLHQRAMYILDTNAENFDGSFIQATALNPQLAMLLDDAQTAYAKSAIEKLLTERMRQSDDLATTRPSGTKPNRGGVDALLAAVVERKNSNVSSSAAVSPSMSSSSSTTSEISSAPSASTASTLYPDLIQAANQRRKQFQDRLQNGKNLFAEAMIQSYFDELMNTEASSPSSIDAGTTATNMPPLHFWQLSSAKCSHLSDIAIELLTVPSCTVSLERIFNYEGVSRAAHPSLELQLMKAMEDPEKMERDAILRFNRAFIPKHF